MLVVELEEIVFPYMQVAIVGQTINMNCSFYNPKWLKDSAVPPADIMYTDRFLTIRKVTLDHEGTYTCIDRESGEQGESTLYVASNTLFWLRVLL